MITENGKLVQPPQVWLDAVENKDNQQHGEGAMAIAGLGGLGGTSLPSPLLPAASATVAARPEVLGNAPSSVVNLSQADFANDAKVMEALPPNTVQYGAISSASLSVSTAQSGSAGATTSDASIAANISSLSYDVSYSTPLQTLQALGLLQPGDVLVSSGEQIMEQGAQVSSAQSVGVSQQNDTDANAGTSSASLSTQQSSVEQNVAVIVSQNWMTPNGINFVSQVMVRVNEISQTDQLDGSTGSMGSSSPDALAGLASVIAQASLLSAASQGQPPSTPTDQGSSGSTPASSAPAVPEFTSAASAKENSADYLLKASLSDGDTTTESLLALIDSLAGAASISGGDISDGITAPAGA